jgi:chromosome segregation ATPase
MSLANLSLSGNQMSFVIKEALYTTVKTNFSYLGGILGCLAVAIGVVFLGAGLAFEMLFTKNEQQEKIIKEFQQLLEKQQEQITLLEKNLELQKVSTQTWYNTQTHFDNEKDQLLKYHKKLFVQHSNDIRSCFDAINRHTSISDNHTETLMNVVRHQQAQTASINELHKEIQHEKERVSSQREMLLELCDNIDHTVDQIEETRNEIDKLSEEMDQSFIEFEVKLEDAIEHFEFSKDSILEKIEEQENQMVSVEDALFEKVLDVSVDLEAIVDGVKDDVKGLSDRVEEMDREVESVEKMAEKLEDDLGTLYDDYLGFSQQINGDFKQNNENENENENKLE